MTLVKTIAVLIALSVIGCGNKPASSSDKPAAGSSDKPAAGSSDKPAAGSSAKPGDDLCARGVSHVMDLMAAESKAHSAAPGPDEQRAMDAAKQASIEQCQKEGFTQAQLDCILAAKDWQTLGDVGDCPAIKDKQPTWLRVP
jgi:hypothetical protein